MDTAKEPLEGGGTRRKRRGRRTRKQTGGAEEEGTYGVSVEKSQGQSGGNPAPAPAPPVLLAPAQPKAVVGGAAKPSVIVLAPAKKKPVRVMLIPKGKDGAAAIAHKRMQHKKTFKAKRVRVTIDNTAKTVKRRRQTMQRVDAMTDDQVREAAVGAKLSRRDSVAKVPTGLLRQMMKDYQSMRGMLL